MEPKVGNLRLMLEEVAKNYGAKTAVVSGERRLSYAELDEASNKVANALMGVGVGRGDRVAMLLTNSPEFVIIYFGIVKIGGIAVPLDVKYKIDELASLFDDSQPKVLVAESPLLELLAPALPRFKYIESVIGVGPHNEGKFLSYQQIIATGSAGRIEVELAGDDVAHIGYTSGPTTNPRGAMLTHRSLVAETAISAYGFQQTDKDIAVLFALPMHHVFGLVGILLTAIYKGSTVVTVSGLSISSVLEIMERRRSTIFMGVPYVYNLMVNAAEKDGIRSNLSSLRLCGSAGAPLPPDIAKRFKKHFGRDIIDFWGLTEATCHITCPPLDGTGRLGSVGKALPGWEIKIVDDNGRELVVNEPGEIIARGAIMKGYYNNPQATAEVIKDGWLYTGDIGRVDEDGYLYILGRKKDTIIRKGQNIYPADIEVVLSAHPKVAEVAVVGIADEMRGEIVRACLVFKEGEVATEEEMRHFCRQHMADYKLPKQILFLPSLPKTAAGEIYKEALKDIPLP